jgi:hypothetical protein
MTPAIISAIRIIGLLWNRTTVQTFFSEAPTSRFVSEGLYFIRTGKRTRDRLPVATGQRANFRWSRKWIISKCGYPKRQPFLIFFFRSVVLLWLIAIGGHAAGSGPT